MRNACRVLLTVYEPKIAIVFGSLIPLAPYYSYARVCIMCNICQTPMTNGMANKAPLNFPYVPYLKHHPWVRTTSIEIQFQF